MYESYWELEAKPFESTSDTRFYYPGESHQGALLKLRYAVESRRSAALLSGAAGLGKTMLIQTLAKQLTHQRLADQTDLATAFNVTLVEGAPQLELRAVKRRPQDLGATTDTGQ